MATTDTDAGVTSATLAQLFDCTVRHVELLAQKGIAVRVGRGRYNAALSTRNYIRHLREQAAARVGQDPEKDGVAANVKFKDASTRLLELRIQKEAGEVLPIGVVRETWGSIMRQVRQFVLGLPGQIGFEVPTLTAHDRRVIERICRDGLEDVALQRGAASGGSGDVPDQPSRSGNARSAAAAAEGHSLAVG